MGHLYHLLQDSGSIKEEGSEWQGQRIYGIFFLGMMNPPKLGLPEEDLQKTASANIRVAEEGGM